jgi:hypothetical protein
VSRERQTPERHILHEKSGLSLGRCLQGVHEKGGGLGGSWDPVTAQRVEHDGFVISLRGRIEHEEHRVVRLPVVVTSEGNAEARASVLSEGLAASVGRRL